MRVIVIGGGVIGALVALRLRDAGVRVVVLEKGSFGRESSWAGAGILCPIQPWLYPDAFTHLVEASLALWPALAEELSVRGKESVEFFRTGLCVPFTGEEPEDEWDQALAWSERFGWKVETLGAEQAQRFEPALSDRVQRVLYWPEVAQVRNPRLLRAARTAILRAGVEVRERAEVVGLLRRNERASGVRLAHGEAIEGDAVVLAAGCWSGELARRFGVSLPVEPVKGEIVLLRAQPGALFHIVKHARVYAVPRRDGRILVGATMQRVGIDRRTTEQARRQLLGAIERVAPALLRWPVERQWTGFRPGTPDGLPFLGEFQSLPGLWAATGHYRNGVVLAPITAEVIAAMLLGERPSLALSAFAPERKVHDAPRIGLPPLGV